VTVEGLIDVGDLARWEEVDRAGQKEALVRLALKPPRQSQDGRCIIRAQVVEVLIVEADGVHDASTVPPRTERGKESCLMPKSDNSQHFLRSVASSPGLIPSGLSKHVRQGFIPAAPGSSWSTRKWSTLPANQRSAERRDDPKLEAVHHYLVEEHWLDYGCIIFSQYYDTSRWIAEELAAKLPGEPIALYAGADRSRLLREGRFVHVERDAIKKAVKQREIRLVVATDAACEGLNLQTLGTLINVDLPWNPSRLEQRIGRIKRFGQARESVDMLNLVYAGTRDEKVYQRLSARMKDRFAILGSLPDVIEDDWIEDIESLDTKLNEYIDKKKRANAFDIRYADTVDPEGEPWEKCAQVLSRRDIVERLSRGW
jgi:hypothetical protein